MRVVVSDVQGGDKRWIWYVFRMLYSGLLVGGLCVVVLSYKKLRDYKFTNL